MWDSISHKGVHHYEDHPRADGGLKCTSLRSGREKISNEFLIFVQMTDFWKIWRKIRSFCWITLNWNQFKIQYLCAKIFSYPERFFVAVFIISIFGNLMWSNERFLGREKNYFKILEISHDISHSRIDRLNSAKKEL